MAQCKYAMREHQISYDDGFSWTSLEVIKGDLIEYQSADCPDSGSEITKWVDLEGDYICEDNRKYKKQVLYVSYDGGATWYIYYPTIYQKGEYVGIDDEFCNNKFEGHYESGATYIDPLKIVKCNGNPTLTSGETTYYDRRYGLISAKIGNCVTTIGENAFAYNNRLSAITIPSGITYIGDSAFYRCSGLQSIIVEPITPPTFGDFSSNVFQYTNDCPIYVPCQSFNAYKSAWSEYASRIQPMSDECALYRTITSTTCISGDLYELDEFQVSYDEGNNWATTATSATTLIESGSSECGYGIQYLTFIPISASTRFKFSNTGLSYSLDDGVTWTEINPNTATPFVGIGNRIMFKGEIRASSSSGIGRFSGSSAFDVEGNPMSLLYGDNFIGQTSLNGKFSEMFSGSSVVNAENLVLPATTLSAHCYEYMFADCTRLTTVPSLPAITLTNYCYSHMFENCSGLTTVPSNMLPATTLADNCYDGMFSGCKSLTTAPQLPATILALACYSNMFYNCKGLTETPVLSAATAMATNACYGMFRGCSSLTTVPDLPATVLAEECYSHMFENCTGLTTAPYSIGDSSTTMAISACCNMFYGCTSLTVAPQLLATTLASRCYSYMFYGCTSLTVAPELLATTLAFYCYQSMFSGCTSLQTAPTLSATTLVDGCYYRMFDGCSSLNEITCLATDISADICTARWLSGVASSGTFYKNPNMTSWESGNSGIPNGWTVLDAT